MAGNDLGTMNWQNVAILRQTWPETRELSVRQGAEKLGCRPLLDQVRDLRQGVLALDRAVAPIVGVMGQLNAGKSSLVRGMLSAEGADRVLCGLDSDQGTHRFVFWLPGSWQRDPVILEALETELERVFGASRELLDQEPARALRQYNGDGAISASFGIPLVGFDPNLDALGFGLLDCPDFQRPHPDVPGTDTSRVRRAFVRKAAGLMSAVVVIASRSGVAEQRMDFFTDPELGLADKPRFLLLNHVRPREPMHLLLEDAAVRRAMDHLAVHELFAAYHNHMDGADRAIPAIAAQSAVHTGMPVFFQIAPEAAGNAASAVEQDRLISSRLAGLAPLELWQELRISRTQALLATLDQLRSALQSSLDGNAARIQEVRAGVLGFVREVCAPDDALRFAVTPSVAEQLTRAMQEAAPAWIRPTMWAAKGVVEVRNLMANAWSWTAKTCRTLAHPGQAAGQQARDAIQRIKSREGRSYFQAETLTRVSRLREFMPEDVDEERLTQAWSEVLQVTNALHVDLPESQVRAFAREVWRGVPVSRKLALVALGPLLLLGSVITVCTAPFDAGGSAIFYAATASELLAALGISAMGAGMAGAMLDKLLLHNVALPTYSRMLSAALDVFALPRPSGHAYPDHFRNLGPVSPRLTPELYPLVPVVLPLIPDAFLAEEIPGSWERVRELALATHGGDVHDA